MPIPKPKPGLVIGYEFLFREDEEVGRENVSRPHPCAVVLVLENGADQRVAVAAISHSRPSPGEAQYRMKLTPSECREMGLDDGEHWINLSDINNFDWPGYDLKPIAPDKGYVFVMMSKATFIRLVSALKEGAGRKTFSRD